MRTSKQLLLSLSWRFDGQFVRSGCLHIQQLPASDRQRPDLTFPVSINVSPDRSLFVLRDRQVAIETLLPIGAQQSSPHSSRKPIISPRRAAFKRLRLDPMKSRQRLGVLSSELLKFDMCNITDDCALASAGQPAVLVLHPPL